MALSKSELAAQNLSDLNHYSNIYIHVERVKNDYFGNPIYHAKILQPLMRQKLSNLVFKHLTKNRVSAKYIRIQSYMGLNGVTVELAEELHSNGLNASIIFLH